MRHPKIRRKIRPKDVDRMANCWFWSGSTLFAQTCLPDLGLHCLHRPVCLICVYTVCTDLSVWYGSTLFAQTCLSDLGLHCLHRPVYLIWVFTVCTDLSVWSGSTLFVQTYLSDLGLHCLHRPVCLTLVYFVCPDLSVRNLRNIMLEHVAQSFAWVLNTDNCQHHSKCRQNPAK